MKGAILFKIKISLSNGDTSNINYSSIHECLHDTALKSLFDDGMITECIIIQNNRKIAALPFMEWTRFEDAVISNSITLLRTKST